MKSMKCLQAANWILPKIRVRARNNQPYPMKQERMRCDFGQRWNSSVDFVFQKQHNIWALLTISDRFPNTCPWTQTISQPWLNAWLPPAIHECSKILGRVSGVETHMISPTIEMALNVRHEVLTLGSVNRKIRRMSSLRSGILFAITGKCTDQDLTLLSIFFLSFQGSENPI